MRYSSLISLAILATPLVPLARAWGQAIGDRPILNVDGNPDYATQGRYDFQDEEVGISAGIFELFPSAATSVVYDSNVFASPAPRRESALAISQALLRAINEPGGVWRLSGEAFVRERDFTYSSGQNTTEYGGSASVVADVSEQDELTANLLGQHRFEARTDVEAPNISQVSLYDDWRATAGYSHTYNRLQLSYSAVGQQFNYDDASQKYRDRSLYEGLVSGTYALQGGTSLLVTGYYSADSYRYVSPLVGGGTAGARLGARYSVPETVELELSAGYFRRDYSQHLGEIAGLTLIGSVVLHPTLLTTVRADVMRGDQPTRIPGAYGKVRTDGLIEVGHFYSRNLNVYARGRVIVDDFDTIRRTDKTILGEMGAFYEMSRNFVLGIEYDISKRNSPATNANFVQHLVSVSLTGRL